MATEKEYDELIAPVLADLAKKCESLGMSIVARVEWEDGAGITQINVESVAQTLTQYAAHSRGNFDSLAIAIKKKFGNGNSIFLRLGG